jgi:hypothetical protein
MAFSADEKRLFYIAEREKPDSPAFFSDGKANDSGDGPKVTKVRSPEVLKWVG